MVESEYKTIKNIKKVYPSKTKYIVYRNPFNVQLGAKQKDKIKKMTKPENVSKFLSIDRSVRRTRTEIKDIMLCNKFDLFATFTFAEDRQNMELCKLKMQWWLHSQQKIHGKFDYLIVPEFHKDGVSLHFHALLRGYKGNIEDSGISKKKVVYKILSYKSGFSHAIKIDYNDGIEPLANYVTKYITKDMPQLPGKKRYWVSRGLLRPVKTHNEHVPPIDMFTETYEDEHYTIHNFPNF
jgi:hypothetical protein